MSKKLYEYFEELSNIELVIYLKELNVLDIAGSLPKDSKCRELLSNFSGYNLNNLRAELNYEVSKRFIDLIDNK